jgi:N-acylneuraminate cytidylyltransferase
LKTFGLIPARGGSKGIPNKNLQEIGGITLVSRSINYAYKSTLLDGIIVSTDSSAIISEVQSTFQKLTKEGGQVNYALKNLCTSSKNSVVKKPQLFIHKRSPLSAGDKSLIAETIKTIFSIITNLLPSEEIFFLLLQPTTPFRGIDEIDQFLSTSRNREHYQPCVSVTKVQDFHPSRMYRVVKNKLYSLGFNPNDEFSPRQDLEEIFIRDGGYYLVTPSMSEKCIPVEPQSSFFIRDFPYSLNIDTSVDLELARLILEKKIWRDNL